jgi:chromosome segregation ATPase
MSSVSNLTAVRALISDAPREELQILTRGLCEELELVKSQLGWIIEEEANAEAVAQALRKELDATKAELGATKAKLDAAEGEVHAATKLFQAMRSDLERLNAENKDLQKKNARLRKQSLGLENQIRGAIAVALREAMGLVDPRRRSPRLAEVAAKKAAKV